MSTTLLRYSYQILGLTPIASDRELKKRYRKLVMSWHPDRNKTTEAEKQFHRVQQAYNLIVTARKKNEDISLEEFNATEPESEYSLAEKLQERYKQNHPQDLSYDEPLWIEFVGFHTAILTILVILLTSVVLLAFSGNWLGASLVLLFPLIIYFSKTLFPIELNWKVYFHYLRSKPVLIKRVLRWTFLILLELWVLVKFVVFTVMPIFYFLALLVLPIVVSYSLSRSKNLRRGLIFTTHSIIMLLYALNYLGASSPKVLTFRLESVSNIYSTHKQLTSSRLAEKYKSCLAIQYISSSASDADYKRVEVWEGRLGIEVVKDIEYGYARSSQRHKERE